MLKSSTPFVGLSSSPFKICQYQFHPFEAMLLGACQFLIVRSFFWIKYFASLPFIMISSNTPSWNHCYLIIVQSLQLFCAACMTHLLTIIWLQTIYVFIFKVCLLALIYFAPWFLIQYVVHSHLIKLLTLTDLGICCFSSVSPVCRFYVLSAIPFFGLFEYFIKILFLIYPLTF